MTTLAEATDAAAETLRLSGVPSPETDARWLVADVAGVDPRREPHRSLGSAEAERLAGLVQRRVHREPLQLVLGTTAFRTIELRCRPGVFIPRPETEVLAGIAIAFVRGMSEQQSHDGRAIVVREPCCGTGAVGLAVASEVVGATIALADRSEAAVALAEENRRSIERAGLLRSHVEVRRGDLLEAFDPADRGAVDVLVANPPYLPAADLAGLDPEVAGHDPHDALSGGADGHELVDRLLAAAADWLTPGGVVLLEIDARRAAGTVSVARRVGLVDVEVHRDLTGAERFVVGRRPGVWARHR
jgi:release factor glutamine methyltransferase